MGVVVIPELRQIKRRIKRERLELKTVADQIGVGASTLERHLAGDYVRSDSVAKYRRWLTGNLANALEPLVLVKDVARRTAELDPVAPQFPEGLGASRSVPRHRRLVVDLFSGAGGMSVGFDLLDGGAVFETVMGIDLEDPMVRVFNANQVGISSSSYPIGRRIDLSDLLNEAEVLCLYLDHLARVRSDDELRQALGNLPHIGLASFISAIRQIDRRFIRELAAIRQSSDYRAEWKAVPSGAMLQTSVIGFHEGLDLPVSSSTTPVLGPLVWADVDHHYGEGAIPPSAEDHRRLAVSLRGKANQRWNDQVARLTERANGAGHGQLASSAGKIGSFLPFLSSQSMRRVKSLWLSWQTERLALRLSMFTERTHLEARRLYARDDRRVSVILGGPPCQGFSRIGRGKLRSLFDQQVHVQADAETGDTRNRLLYKYVLFVSALAPEVFLFENVRHFHSEVRTGEGTFLATDVLAEAIRNVSTTDLNYEVASRVIDASKHLIPQTRERFFMVGVRTDSVPMGSNARQIAEWCINLPEYEPVPASAVLAGLPDPISIDEARETGRGLKQTVEVAESPMLVRDSSKRLLSWIGQASPGQPALKDGVRREVDSHHVRVPRRDDAEFFALLGPGKRWMDYRCDKSETLVALRSMLASLARVVAAIKQKPRTEASLRELADDVDLGLLQKLQEATDGSLSIRLLLETITPLPGELAHHLRTRTYLSKRDGNHGDWLARLAYSRPSKTVMSHMAKDTYGYVHPTEPRTLSVREAARIQTFPDWYSFGALGLVEAFRVVGNAVPPFLSHQLAERVAHLVAAEPSVQLVASSRRA